MDRVASLPSRECGLKFVVYPLRRVPGEVTPLAGAWIEMRSTICSRRTYEVAPFTGAWIEMRYFAGSRSRARVAPFTGAWIEIRRDPWVSVRDQVAPFTGAWIEIGGRRALPGGDAVTPFAGAWIEVSSSSICPTQAASIFRSGRSRTFIGNSQGIPASNLASGNPGKRAGPSSVWPGRSSG